MPAAPAKDPYDELVGDLAYSYEGVFPRETVAAAVAEARALLEPRAKLTTYLPVLVARQAREQLMSAAQAEGRIAKRVPELLFICVHNAGRSQMAAALAEHLSARRVHVRSAGSNPASDAIITMGCGDACPIYPGKRYEDWDVADPAGQPLEVVRDIRDDIQGRVTVLLREILD